MIAEIVAHHANDQELLQAVQRLMPDVAKETYNGAWWAFHRPKACVYLVDFHRRAAR